MVDKREEGYNVSELGNWNVASDYARLKIMKPLDYCDHYENIARFGYDTLLEQLDNFGVPLDALKIIGFERLVNELLKLIGNSRFSMKVAGTKDELEKLEKRLIIIRQVIPALYKTITKKKMREIVLHYDKYYKTLDLVSSIKSEINSPLNKNHLIFTDKPEFDPRQYKKEILEGAITRG